MSLRARIAVPAALAVLALLTAAVRQRVAEPAGLTSPSSSEASPPPLPELTEPFLEAAAALRRRDSSEVRQALMPRLAGAESDAAVAGLVLGFAAHRLGELDQALALLATPNEALPALEDCRLFLLAATARGLGRTELADEALASLLGRFPDSPLRAEALLQAIQQEVDRESWPNALRWIEQARAMPLPLATSREIERFAWAVGAALDRQDVREVAARELLVEHPRLASELGVVDFFEQPGGAIDWRLSFSDRELLQRARRLIDAELPKEALLVLQEIPADQRDLGWQLLQAESLTRDRRGLAALATLADVETGDAASEAAVAWQRALASQDAARVLRGRANLPQSQREQMRALAAEHLQQVARLTDDNQFALRALRRLFELLSDEEDAFDRTLEVLQRLKRLDPSDTSGARFLWRLGWQAYTRQDHPVAIGYWSELRSLYPDTDTSRSGWYWTARTHESLGHEGRARDIYRQILAVDVEDFYSRHAAARLGAGAGRPAVSPTRPTEPWPRDPTLSRALWLSDVGLDELALVELDGRREATRQRAFCAAEAVVLARLGKRRESIRSLVCAFSSLGRAHQYSAPEEALRMYYPLDYREIVQRRAREENLSPYLVFALIRQESAFDADASSWAGARGLMQLMPATGRELARRMGLSYSLSRLQDPDFSVRLGTRYFRQLLEMFDGNQELALAGYNAGPYRIKKLWRQAGSDPELDRFVEGLSLEETRYFVKRVLLFENSYQQLYAERG